MKDNLYFDEDSDASISPETVSIPKIVADLQHEKTEEDETALDATSLPLYTSNNLTHRSSYLYKYLNSISRGFTMLFASVTYFPTVLKHFRHCRVFAKPISCSSGPSAYQSQIADHCHGAPY